jgi:hypothetical protein
MSEPEPDEGNGPVVTIRDNMIALGIVVLLAAANMFFTSHYHPWQFSSSPPTANAIHTQPTIGCCASGTLSSSPKLVPCRCPDTRTSAHALIASTH